MKFLNHLTLAVALLASQWLTAQSYSYKNYSSEQGADKYINGAVQDANGYLFLASNGLFRFDGVNFEHFTDKSGLNGETVSSIFISTDSTLWMGYSQEANITKFKDGEFTHIDYSGISQNKIRGFVQDKKGRVWAALQKSMVLIHSDSLQNFSEPFQDYEVINTIKQADNDHILAGTDMGIVVVKNASTAPEFIFLDEGPYTNVFDFEKLRENIYLAATQDDGLYVINLSKDTPEITQVLDDHNLSSIEIKDLNANINSVFLACDTSFIQLKYDFESEFEIFEYTDLNRNKDINSENISFSLFDREGVLWIGTNGDGIFKRNDDFFTFYTTGEDKEYYDLQTVEEEILASTDNGFYRFSSKKGITDGEWLGSSIGLPTDAISAIHEDVQGDIWLGTRENGLYCLKSGESSVISVPLHDGNLSKNITDLESSDFYIYVATQGGLFQLNKQNLEFNYFDSSKLQHNSVLALIKDADDKIWTALSGKDLPYFEDDELKYETLDENNASSVTGFTTDLNGNKWISTKKGISNITQELSYSKSKNWLFSNYCRGIICDKSNNLIITHRSGITILSYDETLDPPYVPNFYSHEVGINQFYSDAITTDSDGNIWLGSDKGILKYKPDLNKKNMVEPNVVFTHFSINDSIQKSKNIDLSAGDYKIRFDFKGITLADGESVQYQYFLEGHEDNWGDPTYISFEEYNKLPAGDYVFKVRAFNADGVGGNQEASIRFNIDKPIWQKTWFIILIILFISALVYLFIRLREKQLKERQEYLERELDTRTEEVVTKNHELEEKNKDIMDSINYAKHIQDALIPSLEELDVSIPNSFVYFNPRDVVSGDFYWVKKFGDTSIIVGADCTGHGVPGAFISLIGMSILKEISVRKEVQGPDTLLNILEIEIEGTLNKNKSYGVKDGMDLGVMEINHTTRKLRYSAARRPLLVIRGGEDFLLDGDRQSIGGSYEDEPLKEFSLKEFQLEKGDRLYLWSDGYPDQFGGEKGKKLKQKNLIDIIKNMQDKTMDEQLVIARSAFKTWIRDHEQIDDVLLLGIEID